MVWCGWVGVWVGGVGGVGVCDACVHDCMGQLCLEDTQTVYSLFVHRSSVSH